MTDCHAQLGITVRITSEPHGGCSAVSGILRCVYDDERSGANDDADGCRCGAGNCGASGCWIFVGFLVSGVAEYGDSPAEARYSDAAGSAAGAWQNLRRKGVCDAGFVSAPGDTAVVWAA